MPRRKNMVDPVRRMVSVSAETIRAFRFEYRLTTESEAIRRLIDAGLKKFAAKRGSQEDALTPPGAV
jgi:hypothetical protein